MLSANSQRGESNRADKAGSEGDGQILSGGALKGAIERERVGRYRSAVVLRSFLTFKRRRQAVVQGVDEERRYFEV